MHKNTVGKSELTESALTKMGLGNCANCGEIIKAYDCGYDCGFEEGLIKGHHEEKQKN